MPTRCLSLTLSIVLLVACARPPAKPVVALVGDRCSYAGPDRVPMQFTLRWTVDDPVPAGAILEVVSLEPGKTVDDLIALRAETVPPQWLHKLTYDFTYSPGSRDFAVDLRSNAAYRGEPIYIACFHGDRDTALGAAGPLAVIPADP